MLSVAAGSDPAVRPSEYLDGAALAAAAGAAALPILAIDAPPPEAEGVALSLREAGAFAQVDELRMVVVAPRNVLVARAAAADSAALVACELLRAFDATVRRTPVLRLRGRELDLAASAHVMGILNVTSDSFYDGGRYTQIDVARARAAEMVEQGAALVDVGAQSYAAGTPFIPEEEERARAVAVVEALVADQLPAALSVDTTRATVAEAALAAGAHLVNDCSGLADPQMEHVVARHDAALVVMHLKGRLNVRTPEAYVYDDVMSEVAGALRAGVERAVAAGVRRESLVIDPGLEFGKEPPTDLEILARFGDLTSLGVATLLAASRKSFLGRLFGRPANGLLVPSLTTAALGILAGADIVRTHDVAETVDVTRTLAAVRAARAPAGSGIVAQ